MDTPHYLGGIYVCNGNPDAPIAMPNLDHARDLILELVKDFLFVSDSDKSRALAAILAPALRAGRLLGEADFPIDIAEANEPQSGKTFRLKLNCAIYGVVPYIIANRDGGVGSLDESISSALVSGIPFILFDNFRGTMNSQLAETCLRGTGMVPARIPHRGEVQLSTSYVNWQLSSNGLQANRDFVNRSLITRILKREPNYKFSHYQTGNILANVKAKQPLVLGAVFRIIKEWFDRGCLRSDDTRHDFVEYAQTLDWIVQNIFQLSPLLDGHTEEVLRVSDPALSWLRLVAIAVHKDNRLHEFLSATNILDIAQAHTVSFPGNVFTINPDQLSMYTGKLLARIFKDSDSISIDHYLVTKESRTESHPQASRAGHVVPFEKHFYCFRDKDSAAERSLQRKTGINTRFPSPSPHRWLPHSSFLSFYYQLMVPLLCAHCLSAGKSPSKLFCRTLLGFRFYASPFANNPYCVRPYCSIWPGV